MLFRSRGCVHLLYTVFDYRSCPVSQRERITFFSLSSSFFYITQSIKVALLFKYREFQQQVIKMMWMKSRACTWFSVTTWLVWRILCEPLAEEGEERWETGQGHRSLLMMIFFFCLLLGPEGRAGTPGADQSGQRVSSQNPGEHPRSV